MNIEEFRDYCLLKPGVTEETPFGPETLVFKVGGKMFALTDIDTFGSINLKCDPERAAELREAHDYVLPGFHMSKLHWNTVLIGTAVPERQLRELIDHSYELVRASLPKAVKAALELGLCESESERSEHAELYESRREMLAALAARTRRVQATLLLPDQEHGVAEH